MATANVKKQPPTATASTPTRSYKPPGSARTTTARSSTPSKDKDSEMKVDPSTPKPKDGAKVSTPGTPFSAKAALSRRGTNAAAAEPTEQELETAAEMEELKKKLAQAEARSLGLEEDLTKQIKALQARIDESLAEHIKLEELLATKNDAVETLENSVKELQRSKKDQEKLHESERNALMTEKEELLEKEEAQSQIIQRLKSSLSSKEKNSDVPDTTEEKLEDPVPVVSPRATAQKDKLIESLRAELSEAQNRFAEALKLEERKQQDAADQLSELRKTNVKLQEEHESFQLLLGQATMNGEIRNGFLGQWAADSAPSTPSKEIAPSLGSTLAEEIDAASQKEGLDEVKKLEAEIKTLKDQNKAMTLYINTMIERLLNSNQEGILDRTADTEKALPPVPQETTAIPINRSKSLLGKRPPIRTSMPPPARVPVNEEDGIAPIQRSQTMQGTTMAGRGHRRTQSDAPSLKSPTSPTSGFSLVNNMYRPEGPGSPTPRQTTFYTGPRFGGPLSPTGTRAASSSNSSENGDANKDHTLSGQMTGKTLRPLRLVDGSGPAPPAAKGAPSMMGGRKVSEAPSIAPSVSSLDDDEKKKNKRTSWIGGWFNKGAAEKPEDLPPVAEAPKAVPVIPVAPATATSTSSVE